MQGWGSRGTPHPLYAPCTRGWVEPPPEPSPSRTTSVPNFVPIGPAVWISIENTQTNKHTHIALYVLDSLQWSLQSSKLCLVYAWVFYVIVYPVWNTSNIFWKPEPHHLTEETYLKWTILLPSSKWAKKSSPFISSILFLFQPVSNERYFDFYPPRSPSSFCALFVSKM